MPTTLLATQCPLPVFDTAHTRLYDREVTAISSNGLSARYFSAGDTTTVPSSLNRNTAQLDLQGRYGGGGYAVLVGLAISAGSGLTLNVAAGQALIDGIVEIPSATTLAVPDGHSTATDRVWVWLSRAGVLSYTLTTTAPATNCCCIGSCTTSGGAITAVDTSGVVYLKGGALWRETADDGPPTDSPSSALTLFTKTPGGVFFWDTTAHRPFYEYLSPNRKSLSSGQSVQIENGEQVVIYGGLTITSTGVLQITGDGELITL